MTSVTRATPSAKSLFVAIAIALIGPLAPAAVASIEEAPAQSRPRWDQHGYFSPKPPPFRSRNGGGGTQ